MLTSTMHVVKCNTCVIKDNVCHKVQHVLSSTTYVTKPNTYIPRRYAACDEAWALKGAPSRKEPPALLRQLVAHRCAPTTLWPALGPVWSAHQVLPYLRLSPFQRNLRVPAAYPTVLQAPRHQAAPWRVAQACWRGSATRCTSGLPHAKRLAALQRNHARRHAAVAVS